jgi:TolB-like protein/DNA-binding winged helix-turn-helix (wHTH) protein/tetratricopeptide (TPR) repeat protein
MPEAVRHSIVHRFGAYELNLQSGELRKKGVRLKLAGQPIQLLAVLVERAGEVVSREELRSKLWLVDTFVDFDHGLNNAVARIREVLNDSSENPRYIETIPRRGYRFIGQLQSAQQPAVVPAEAEPATCGAQEATEQTLSVAFPQQTSSDSQDQITRPARPPFKLALVGAAVIALFAASLAVYRDTRMTEVPRIKSLAVLPLKNLSGDPAQEYLADGITEEVIGRLATLRGVRVISRTSSMHFKDTTLSAPEIAEWLGVDALVEGSVIRQGSHIRVQAQLIRATDEHFWSETYDREIGDVLALESQFAQSIAEKVAGTVTRQEYTRLATARHVSPEVYEIYLKGKLSPRNTKADLGQNRTYFEEAIRKDPTFAPAYVGLARTYSDMATLFLGGAPPREVNPKILAAARKALELDPDIAEAHALIGDVYQKVWQWSDAKAEYERALELKPSDAAAHMAFAKWLAAQGRLEEAITWSRRGRILDPLGVAGVESGWVLFCARRYDDAIRELRNMLAVRPDLAKAQWYLGFVLIANGQPEQAIVELEKTAAMTQRSPGSLEILAAAYGYAGRRQDAIRIIDELKHRSEAGYVPAGAFVNPYLGLGDYDQALAGYERAYKEQSPVLQWVNVIPFADPLRGDPRFQDLVRRVGLK